MLQVENALQDGLSTADIVRREFERSFGVGQTECGPPSPCFLLFVYSTLHCETPLCKQDAVQLQPPSRVRWSACICVAIPSGRANPLRCVTEWMWLLCCAHNSSDGLPDMATDGREC